MLILDGPLGTELSRRGVRTQLPEWSAHALRGDAALIAEVHRDYADAGAVVHTACTFRTRRRLFGDAFEAMTHEAVSVCRGAIPRTHRVAGSLAPLMDCYRPDLSPDDPGPEHEEMARVLADAGCDLIVCETFPHVGEALAAVRAAVATGLETWVAFTAGPNADLMTPAEMREGARQAVEEGASAVLVNCVPAVATQRFLEAIAAEAGAIPFGAYANAGSPNDAVGWDAPAQPGSERYLRYAESWAKMGASIIGSCCGTTPEHIRRLAARLG